MYSPKGRSVRTLPENCYLAGAGEKKRNLDEIFVTSRIFLRVTIMFVDVERDACGRLIEFNAIGNQCAIYRRRPDKSPD